jgi:hypothetical protein
MSLRPETKRNFPGNPGFENVLFQFYPCYSHIAFWPAMFWRRYARLNMSNRHNRTFINKLLHLAYTPPFWVAPKIWPIKLHKRAMHHGSSSFFKHTATHIRQFKFRIILMQHCMFKHFDCIAGRFT